MIAVAEDIFNTERSDTATAVDAVTLKAINTESVPDTTVSPLRVRLPLAIYAVLPAPYGAEWVGTLHFDPIAVEWIWTPLDRSDNPGTPHSFDIDRQEQAKLRQDYNQALATQGATSDALMVEVRGRIALHRDETQDLAILGAKMQARSYLSTYFCTGYEFPAGGPVQHDGDTCPIHETGEPA